LLAKSGGIVKNGRETYGGPHPSYSAAAGDEPMTQLISRCDFRRSKKIGERFQSREPLRFVHARTDRALASVLLMLDKAIQVT